MQVEKRLDNAGSDAAGIRGVIAKVGQRQVVDSDYLKTSGQGHQRNSQVAVFAQHFEGWTIARFRGLDKTSLLARAPILIGSASHV